MKKNMKNILKNITINLVLGLTALLPYPAQGRNLPAFTLYNENQCTGKAVDPLDNKMKDLTWDKENQSCILKCTGRTPRSTDPRYSRAENGCIPAKKACENFNGYWTGPAGCSGGGDRTAILGSTQANQQCTTLYFVGKKWPAEMSYSSIIGTHPATGENKDDSWYWRLQSTTTTAPKSIGPIVGPKGKAFLTILGITEGINSDNESVQVCEPIDTIEILSGAHQLGMIATYGVKTRDRVFSGKENTTLKMGWKEYWSDDGLGAANTGEQFTQASGKLKGTVARIYWKELNAQKTYPSDTCQKAQPLRNGVLCWGDEGKAPCATGTVFNPVSKECESKSK